MSELKRRQEDEFSEPRSRFKAERVTEINEEVIDRSYSLDALCYPSEMMADREEYELVLQDPTGVHVALEDEQGFCGQILAYDIFGDEVLAEADPEVTKEKQGEALYVYTTAIRPNVEGAESVRGIEALKTLWDRFRQEATDAGYEKIVAYARVDNGMSDILQAKCGAQALRRKENWLDMGKDFDYVEIPLKKEKKEE